jgi:hypothetical protein
MTRMATGEAETDVGSNNNNNNTYRKSLAGHCAHRAVSASTNVKVQKVFNGQ